MKENPRYSISITDRTPIGKSYSGELLFDQKNNFVASISPIPDNGIVGSVRGIIHDDGSMTLLKLCRGDDNRIAKLTPDKGVFEGKYNNSETNVRVEIQKLLG